MVSKQLPLFSGVFKLNDKSTADRSSTFVDNMQLPIHRWFRYSAGFSAQWVEQEIRQAMSGGMVQLLDPFAGAGTTLLEGERCGIPVRGVEAHPFVCRIARARLAWRESPDRFWELAQEVNRLAQRQGGDVDGYPDLVVRCYPPQTLAALDALKRAWKVYNDGSPLSELVWLALVAILRVCSPVGTAQWQYVLPRKEKKEMMPPDVAFQIQVSNMAADMRWRQQMPWGEPARIFQEDARVCPSLPDGWATLVITSPPYTNNYDYADATRLEMSFWGEVSNWGELQQKVRRFLIRSCTQHVAAEKLELDEILQDANLTPIVDELRQQCKLLAEERLLHGGKKPYHLMIAAYFSDLARVWKTLRRVIAEGGRACFVVGDSAPYGIYVPVDRWLGELAIAAGFRSYYFEKIRDRNVKWKNRKHRVPLHEGRLWVEG